MNHIKTAEEVFNKNAALYQTKYMDVGLYHHSLDAFCAHIPKPNARILDIACGPGNITRYLLEKRPDFQITGIDFAEQMIALAKANNPSASFQRMDAKAIGTLTPNFDGVMCGFCLPYLSKTEAISLIQDASSILNPGGVFYLSTMEDDYSKSGYIAASTGDQVYMYYHEAAYLVEALEEAGFKILSLIRQDFPNPSGQQTTDLLILAEK